MVTKKKTKFFKSLRFRILVILIILGIVPSAIVTQLMISNYEKQAIEVKVSEVSTQCAILCNQIIKENYLNDSSSQSVNSKLELLSNVYGGRMVIVDRDLKVVAVPSRCGKLPPASSSAATLTVRSALQRTTG